MPDILPMASAGDVPEGLLFCAGESNDQNRLACDDHEMRRLQPPADAAEPSANAAAEPQPGIAAASERAAQPMQETQPINDSPKPKNPGEISAVVTKVARQPHGEHLVYLNNGQVWDEQSKSSYFPIDIGDTITIKKRRTSGFCLGTESGKACSIKRLPQTEVPRPKRRNSE